MRISLRRMRALLCVFAGVGFVFTAFKYFGGAETIAKLDKYSERCEAHLLNTTVSKLCTDYKNGTTAGALCEPLCVTGELKLTGCIHHHTTVVLLGNYKDKQIVLKKKMPTSRRGETLGYYGHLFNQARTWDQKLALLKQCLLDLLSYKVGDEMKRLKDINIRIEAIMNNYLPFLNANKSSQLFKVWEHFEDDEFSFYTFYHDFEYFPSIVGTCGTMYAVERARSLTEFVPNVGKSVVPWNQRILISLSLLNMVSSLETAVLGPLHMCDIQVSNFGVMNEIDISAIDVDMIFTNEKMTFILPQPNCTNDDQCDFFDCLSTCDTQLKHCTATKRTSNFQLICGKLLYSKYFGYGLIGDVLPKINPQLTLLLHKCASKEFGYFSFSDPQVQTLYKSIRELLLKEI